MGEFSPLHWLVVIAIVLLLFGPKKLPELAKSVGEGLREFKKSLSASSTEEKPAAPAAAPEEHPTPKS